MNDYLKRILEETAKKNADQPEYLQAIHEVLTSIEPVIEQHSEYERIA